MYVQMPSSLEAYIVVDSTDKYLGIHIITDQLWCTYNVTEIVEIHRVDAIAIGHRV